MNYLDFDRRTIRHRNDELLREVQELRLEKSLRANRGPRRGLPPANNLVSRSLFSLLRRTNPSG